MRPIQIVIVVLLGVALFIKGTRLYNVVKERNKGAIKAELLLFLLMLIIGVFLLIFLKP